MLRDWVNAQADALRRQDDKAQAAWARFAKW